MRKKQYNIIIRDAFLEAAALEYAQELSDTTPVEKTDRFEEKMRFILSKREPIRSLRTATAKAAAIFLCICSLSFGVVMLSSSTVRADFIRWMVRWYENSALYSFFGTENNISLPLYYIAKLPDSYDSYGEIMEMVNSIEIIYSNNKEENIYFSYMYMKESVALQIDTSNMRVSDIQVNGNNGYIYSSADPEQSNLIVWFDEESGIQFMIDGFFDKEQLLSMAESVLQKK